MIMINVNDVIAWESGEMSEERERKFFQEMVNDGSVWKLQGCYGRRAMALLEAGVIKYPTKQTYDYYGNPIPTRARMRKVV
jgi:hypothetical protein